MDRRALLAGMSAVSYILIMLTLMYYVFSSAYSRSRARPPAHRGAGGGVTRVAAALACPLGVDPWRGRLGCPVQIAVIGCSIAHRYDMMT